MDKLLLREQEKFQAIFQNASLGILVINNKGKIVLANDFLLKQFGYSSIDEILGKSLGILIPSRYHQKHKIERDTFIKNPEIRAMGIGRDLFGMKKDGTEMMVEISLSSYTSEDEVFSIAFISDISARVETQDKLREQRLALAGRIHERCRRRSGRRAGGGFGVAATGAAHRVRARGTVRCGSP